MNEKNIYANSVGMVKDIYLINGKKYTGQTTSVELTEENVDEIIEILMHSYIRYESIAETFNVGIKAIQNINSGRFHKREDITYPIRDYKNSGTCSLTYEEVSEIILLLKETETSFRQISLQYKTTFQTIQSINLGSSKKFKRKEENYPLRNFN